MPLRRRRVYVLLLCFGIPFVILCFYKLSSYQNCSMGLECFVNFSSSEKKQAQICVLPILHPFDKSIRHLIKNYSEDVAAVCKSSSKVFQLLDRRIKIRDSPLFENVLVRSAKYETVIRPRGQDDIITYGSPVPVSEDDKKISSDFVKVSYRLKNGMKKVEMFAQIVEKQKLLERKPLPNSVKPKLNIILMGLDSTSNANFKRKLGGSFNYLVEKLKAFIFNGYSILGDGTTPALTAILTGHLPSTMIDSNRTDLRSWPWIMKNYKRNGYVTLFAEDDPQVASFTKLGGFRNPPADHYIRPFWLAVERHDGFDRRRHDKSSLLHKVCLNDEPIHNITLNYVRDFLNSYDGMPKFAFPFFSYLPHGTGEKLSLADKDLLSFLENFEKHRNDTILIIFGDHGARVGNIRNTIQGAYEEHLPWLSMVVPPWFHERYPHLTGNLTVNQHRITSPFDLHHTLHHVLNLETKPRGTSLMSHLHPLRTCADAGVMDVHWCPCLRWQAQDVNVTPVKRGAELLVEHINNMILKRRLFVKLCFTVYLVKIILAARAESQNENDVVFYQVTIATHPGDGIFQATFKLYPNSKMVMSPHVSRTSTYGRNPWCLGRNHQYMKRFCTCKAPHRKHAKGK